MFKTAGLSLIQGGLIPIQDSSERIDIPNCADFRPTDQLIRHTRSSQSANPRSFEQVILGMCIAPLELEPPKSKGETMKKILFVIGLVAALVTTTEAEPRVQTPLGVSFNLFYSSLSPYGEWIAVGGDVYAWRPGRVASGWRPYTEGRWAWTDDGWYWLSDEPWGWAVFHYGRWYYDDYYGWLWIPGYEWAPAWVEWRYGRGYIGWAPLSPYAIFSMHFGIYYRTRWHTPYHYWAFVDCGYVTTPHMRRHIYRTDNNTRFIGRTRGAGNVRHDGGRIITRGPDREYIERSGNIRVERTIIRDVDDVRQIGVDRSGGGERVSVYRPSVEERSDVNRLERPEKFRENERSIDLDTRRIDVRSREVDRESGRDFRGADEYRTPRNLDRDAMPPINPDRTRDGRDRGIDRAPDRNDGTREREQARPDRRESERQYTPPERRGGENREGTRERGDGQGIDRPQGRTMPRRDESPARPSERQRSPEIRGRDTQPSSPPANRGGERSSPPPSRDSGRRGR